MMELWDQYWCKKLVANMKDRFLSCVFYTLIPGQHNASQFEQIISNGWGQIHSLMLVLLCSIVVSQSRLFSISSCEYWATNIHQGMYILMIHKIFLVIWQECFRMQRISFGATGSCVYTVLVNGLRNNFTQRINKVTWLPPTAKIIVLWSEK